MYPESYIKFAQYFFRLLTYIAGVRSPEQCECPKGLTPGFALVVGWAWEWVFLPWAHWGPTQRTAAYRPAPLPHLLFLKVYRLEENRLSTLCHALDLADGIPEGSLNLFRCWTCVS